MTGRRAVRHITRTVECIRQLKGMRCLGDLEPACYLADRCRKQNAAGYSANRDQRRHRSKSQSKETESTGYTDWSHSPCTARKRIPRLESKHNRDERTNRLESQSKDNDGA